MLAYSKDERNLSGFLLLLWIDRCEIALVYTTIVRTIEHTGLGDVPHSRCLNNVPDDKLLDGLVFGHTAGTVGAADGLNVAPAFLGTAVVPPFLGLGKQVNC